MKLMGKYLFGCLLSLLVCLTAAPSWAAITYVGGQCGSFAGTTSAQSINFALAGGSDAAPLTGDLVLIAYNIAAAGDPTLVIDNPSGTDYALQGSEMFADETVEDTNLRVAARVMPDPTETSFTLSVTVGAGKRWIACQLEFRGWKRGPLLQPGRFTELFFLDEATAFAAGHRPCALCRREDYDRFSALWSELHPGQTGADVIDAQLHSERVAPVTRTQLHHKAPLDDLPDARSSSRTTLPSSFSAHSCFAGPRGDTSSRDHVHGDKRES